jgi:hypothetical protein
MDATRPIQFFVYLISALVLGYLTFMSMMWGGWGAPVHPAHYIALLGALGLVVAALLSLARPTWGRVLSVVALSGMGTFWIPAVVSLVPQYDVIVSPTAYVVVSVYFGVVGFSLLYPRRLRWSIPAFAIILCLALSLVGITVARRIQSGEYQRPAIVYFRWQEGSELIVEDDVNSWINAEAKTLLENAGVRGRLKWTGASGEQGAAHRIILLVKRQPPVPYQLRYPRVGTIIYAYNGTEWRMIPNNAATFSSFATLEPEGSRTMLWQDAGGGREGTEAFGW